MASVAWSEMDLTRDDPREQKRMAVLRTGARLFNEHGFDRTSLDDIASELNVSKRTLYYYVKNKDDILFECSRLALEFMEETLASSQNNDLPPLERIAMIMRSYLDLLSNEFGACLALSNDNVLSEESRKTLRKGRKKLDQAIRDLVDQGVKDGSIAPCEPKLAAAAIFGAFNWVPYWQTRGNRETYSEIANSFLNIFLDGLRARK
ncbi:TetR family transcriptional regulator [Sneathiella chungangensis]|uniref:TetR family transcriptional regulator n=1 Tax=Sneathiella chungangensis TaxID=1418234 RepID=A0A845MFG1_9PROT|nr:TetR/AcrR family transcriptional regulator [Sneathiella chungangensis]MZR22718.1 TetR family transcriptional regulator [Sneathiella chungangensis]